MAGEQKKAQNGHKWFQGCRRVLTKPKLCTQATPNLTPHLQLTNVKGAVGPLPAMVYTFQVCRPHGLWLARDSGHSHSQCWACWLSLIPCLLLHKAPPQVRLCCGSSQPCPLNIRHPRTVTPTPEPESPPVKADFLARLRICLWQGECVTPAARVTSSYQHLLVLCLIQQTPWQRGACSAYLIFPTSLLTALSLS